MTERTTLDKPQNALAAESVVEICLSSTCHVRVRDEPQHDLSMPQMDLSTELLIRSLRSTLSCGRGRREAPSSTTRPPEAALDEVLLLAAAIDPRYRAFVLLAVFGSLRWGELMGLRRSDFDMVAGLVHIERAVSEIGARQVMKKPKAAAGVRTVALPRWLMPELRRHFDTYAEAGQDGRVFVGSKGATPLRPNFSSVWARALDGAGLAGIHIHDLRHAGNHFAAMTGASTRELMGRMGHASMDAALIYQHRTADRDRVIADAIDLMLTGLGAGPDTLAVVGASESDGDGHGHREGAPAQF